MKKYLSILFAAVLLITFIAGCAATGEGAKNAASESETVSAQPAGSTAAAAPSGTEGSAAGSKTEQVPNVYMTTDISPSGLIDVYNALERQAAGNVAVKLTVGEPGGNYYLSPDLIKDFVLSVNGSFVDSNTAYGGLRATTAMHMQAAEDHGFTAYTSMDILDQEGEVSLPVLNGAHLKEDLVGSHYENYDFFVILSHFKGHAVAGYGGAIKNMSIGIASVNGKNNIHNAGAGITDAWLQAAGRSADTNFLESMAEAAKAVADDRGDNILYINVMNNLSVDCDCDSHPAPPRMEDIGILASLDPVALDKACIDLVYAASDGEALVKRIEALKGVHTLDYAQQIGLGSENYNLIKLDK